MVSLITLIKDLSVLPLILFIITLSISLLLLKRRQTKLQNECDLQILGSITYYKITNIYYTLFNIVIYICFLIGSFIYMRISILGTKYNIETLPLSYVSINIIIIFLLLCIVLILILSIIDLHINKEIIKLHYYLYRYNFYVLFNDWVRDKLFWFRDRVIGDITGFITRITYFNEHDDIPLMITVFPTRYKLITYFRDKTRKYILLKQLFLVINVIFTYIAININHWLYYLPIYLIILSLIFDVYYMQLYITLYMLGLYFIIQLIRRGYLFLVDKDYVLDNLIYIVVYIMKVNHLY